MATNAEHDSDGELQAAYESDYFDPEALEDGDDIIHVTGEENYEDRFKAASKEIRSKKKYTTRGDVEEFFEFYGDIAGISTSKIAGNLLHALVEVVQHTDDVEPTDIELLVRQLVRTYPHLLESTNKDGHNPLFMAIRKSQHQLVEYMVSTCLEVVADDDGVANHREHLDEALRQKAQEGKTCLHFALKENLDPETTKMLIENATDEALGVQDGLGKTPMHYAVAFSQCTDERAQLISLLIERDQAATQANPRPSKTFLDIADKSGSSVYQEHELTRAVVIKKYQEHKAKVRRTLENRKREVNDAVRDRPVMREPPRPNAGAREATSRSTAKPGGDEGDEREALRQQKKAEEAARLKESQAPAKLDRREERDGVGRDASRSRPSRVTEPDRSAPQIVIRTNYASRQAEPAPNTPIKRSNTARLETKPDQEKAKPKPKQPVRPAPTARKSGGNMQTWTKNSDEILLSLKLHYMRTRNEEKAISFLYGTNMDDVRISFNYEGLPRKLTWNDFITRFSEKAEVGIKFDPVLQYVSFPHVEVGVRGRLADRERDAELQSGMRQLGHLGRKDMRYFFEWLYKKGVRHIIQLSVDDCGNANEKVHSDEAIQASLERFIIENLDWRKVDLDPETILHVSSKIPGKEDPTDEAPKSTSTVFDPDRQLKQLHLRWSGSNAVLRAWSEPEGLPMLPRLQRVYLFRPTSDKMYDNAQWTNQKVRDFSARLNQSRKTVRAVHKSREIPEDSGLTGLFGHVEVITGDLGTEKDHTATARDTASYITSAPVKGVNSHRWLNSTAKFAEEMKPFWERTVEEFMQSRQGKATPEHVEDGVVVALIDDGVDVFDTAYSSQVLEGKSFDFHNGKVRPPFSSAKGHGTVMANMILRICPMAKVYPIRLRTFNNANGKSNIDKDYAAQAVQAALDKKASIISMSWTLPMGAKDKSDTGAKDRLHAVLEKAVEKKVLMFCSAPDEGKFTELDYPSGPWRDRFFRIGAASADGKVFQWTPDVGITYVLPGVDVVKDQVGSRIFETPASRGVTNRVTEVKYETGSSVATALAAGLAAMIVYCVKASIIAAKTVNQNKGDVVGIPIPDNGASLIADPDAMKRAFARLGSVTSNNFIQVWEKLDKVSELLEGWNRMQNAAPEAKLKFIREFTEFGLWLADAIKQ